MAYALHDRTRIYWTEVGSGDPILLIMGLGATHEWWERVVPIVSPRFRTILFDNRGVGRSDTPPGPYSIPAMASDAVAVLDAAGVTAAHVFGASMGGMIAQEMALSHPDRVRSLILGCTNCGGRETVQPRREVSEALNARATMTREQAMRTMVPFIFDAGTPCERIEQDLAIRLRATVPDAGYFAQLQAIRSWAGTHSRLHAIGTPVLVIHGESDELVPVENGRVLARAIPNATLEIVPHASHIFLTDQTRISSDAILGFLGKQAMV